MDVKIDSAGRIVLPKQIRDRWRIRAGSKLQLEEAPQGILLRPAEQPGPAMVKLNGLWVHLGKPPEGFDWDTIIEDDREERIKDIWGR